MRLFRHPPRARLGETPFAVVDLETTGLRTKGYDRIVEVAVVRMAPDGRIAEEYSTLVNPERDVGPTHIHGITASDVVHAPRFADVAGEVAQRISDAVVVAHNLRFDLDFLVMEYGRLGATFPEIPSLCTLDLAYKLLPGIPSRKLAHCCGAVGVPYGDAHHALSDARATAGLLSCYLEAAGCERLEELGCECLDLPGSDWITWPVSGRTLSRAAAAKKQTEDRGYLARLVERLPGAEAGDARQAQYLNLLDRALEDRRITPQEAEELIEAALAWGMSRGDLKAAHRAYMVELVAEALEDSIITSAERSDLEAVNEMLGFDAASLELLIAQPVKVERPKGAEDMTGKRVCFTGALLGRIGGELITREQAQEMARRAGLVVRSSVSSKTDILVVADPNTSSGKAKKARECGTRIMAEAVFWKTIGAPVD